MPDEQPTTPQDFSWGDERPCASPQEGWDRFREEGAWRGLDVALPGAFDGEVYEGTAALAVADLDADGDLDLVLGPVVGPPLLYLNDGEGFFEPGPPLEQAGDGMDGGALLAAVDLDDDGLPELAVAGRRLLVWDEPLDGLGADQFIDLPTGVHNASLAVGDADDDGDLDLFVATFALGPGSGAPAGQLLLNDGGTFTSPVGVVGALGGVNSQAALFTDRDRDGRSELLVCDGDTTLEGQATAWLHNRAPEAGDLDLVDEAASLDADLSMAAMGVDSADFNGDGYLDYCFTDLGPTRCIQSDEDRGYVETTAIVGLLPDEPAWQADGVPVAIGWGFALADIDNDGWEDALQTGAPDHGSQLPTGFRRFPDLAWRGTPAGTFVDLAGELDFGDREARYAVAAADLDGDGFLDAVVAGPGVAPLLHLNRCSAASWFELELEGPPGNREGLGAIVKVRDSRRVQLRELHGTRVRGQGPSRLHFGLGADQAVSDLSVHWPDGHVSSLDGIPGRRLVTVTHPDAD